MTVYTFDTEFIEDGRTIDLISIGIVCEDGREYYAVASDAPWLRINEDRWLVLNVLPYLGVEASNGAVAKAKKIIADEVRDFLLAADSPELWADYAAYDHVVLCQLWGRMIDLPQGLPMFTHDVRHEASMRGIYPPEQESGAHNALEDARHVMSVLREWEVA